MTITGVIAGLMLLGAVPGALGQRPDLTGHWIYNSALSDNPRDQLGGDSSGEGGRRGGFDGRRGGTGLGGGSFGGSSGDLGVGGGGWSGMNEEMRERMRQTIQLAFEPPRALSISQTESTVSFVVDATDTLTLRTDGRKFKQKFQGAGDIENRARWEGSDLIVDRSVSEGGKVVEDYLRSKDGKQLYVVVSFTGRRGRTIQFRRIYDPAPPG
jgi:hypothetical protein